jgi:hypothetical protein
MRERVREGARGGVCVRVRGCARVCVCVCDIGSEYNTIFIPPRPALPEPAHNTHTTHHTHHTPHTLPTTYYKLRHTTDHPLQYPTADIPCSSSAASSDSGTRGQISHTTWGISRFLGRQSRLSGDRAWEVVRGGRVRVVNLCLLDERGCEWLHLESVATRCVFSWSCVCLYMYVYVE